MCEKVCNKCGASKPQTTEFYNQLSTGYWRGVCKKCMAENSRKHHQSNPDLTAKRRQKYKDQLRSASGSHDESDIARQRAKQNDVCFYCGKGLAGSGEVDHRIPVSRGGDNGPENIVIACLECNRDKHSKTDEEFIAWRLRLRRPVRKQ